MSFENERYVSNRVDRIEALEQEITRLKKQLAEAVGVIEEKSSIIDDIAKKFNQTTLQELVLKSENVRFRLHEFIEKTPDCWNWIGSKNKSGYGQISINSKPYLAHRVMSAFVFKNFYDFYIVDHKCMNKSCVNPDHLRLVGSRINALQNSNSMSARYSKNTHCKNGHELFGDNVRVRMDGGRKTRVCKTCIADQKRARKFLAKYRGGK